MESPVGPLQLVASEKGICGLYFKSSKRHDNIHIENAIEGANHPVLIKAKKQLDEYFAGKRQQFDLPLDMQGTIFQIKTWKELQKIPYGTTLSYGEQAQRVGDAKKARAVGAANGRNPISIIVPCHRVIGTSGAITGYAGGVENKEWLLALETKALGAKSAA